MRNLKTLIATAAMAVCGISSVSAQHQGCVAEKLGYKPYPYGFVQVQGGLNTVFTDVNALDIINPTFSVAGGYMFTPAVGARLHVNGIQAKGGFDLANGLSKYKHNYVNTNADLMVNLLNVFRKTPYSPFNLYLVGGIGLNYAWGNDDFDAITSQTKVPNDISNAWGDAQTPRHSLLSHNIRAGLLADVNICKHWSVGLEVDMNSLDDRFNSKYNNSDDWMLTAQLSLTYKFGHKAPCKHTPEPVAKPEPKPQPVAAKEEPKPVAKEEPKAVPATPVAKSEPQPVAKEAVVEVEPLKETFFYQISESDPESNATIKKIVTWCKKYPNKKISVDGYADKGTGTPEINVHYAKERANKVAKQLQKAGVPASQMTVNSYGDKVQPFTENDKNRCVIVVGNK